MKEHHAHKAKETPCKI